MVVHKAVYTILYNACNVISKFIFSFKSFLSCYFSEMARAIILQPLFSYYYTCFSCNKVGTVNIQAKNMHIMFSFNLKLNIV